MKNKICCICKTDLLVLPPNYFHFIPPVASVDNDGKLEFVHVGRCNAQRIIDLNRCEPAVLRAAQEYLKSGKDLPKLKL